MCNIIYLDHRDVERRLDDDRYRRSGSRERRNDYRVNNMERSSAVDDRNHTNRDTPSYRPKDKAVRKSNTTNISSNKSQSGRDQRTEVIRLPMATNSKHAKIVL